MSRQACVSIEFVGGETFQVGDKRVSFTRLTNQDMKLEVDEELGIVYAGARRYSVHCGLVRHWTVLAPPSKQAVPKK